MNITTNLTYHHSLIYILLLDYALHVYYLPLSTTLELGHTLLLSHFLSITHISVTTHQYNSFILLHDLYNPLHSILMSFSRFTRFYTDTRYTLEFYNQYTLYMNNSLFKIHFIHTPIIYSFPFIRLSFLFDSSFYIPYSRFIAMQNSLFTIHITVEQENERSFSLQASSVPFLLSSF